MNILELFSGTGSVGKIAEEYGQVVSVDINDNMGYIPTHIVDILKWDYKQYPVGYFDMIWASPPCRTFSSMLFLTKTKDQINEMMENEGIPLLKKTLEIIDYFKPTYYCIENPDAGRMKNYIWDLPCKRVSYCRYGFNNRKNTRLWTNINFEPLFCNHKGKHGQAIQPTRNGKKTVCKLANRYAIPENLIRNIFDQI